MGSSLESFDIFEAMLCWFLITVKANLFPPIFSHTEAFPDLAGAAAGALLDVGELFLQAHNLHISPLWVMAEEPTDSCCSLLSTLSRQSAPSSRATSSPGATSTTPMHRASTKLASCSLSLPRPSTSLQIAGESITGFVSHFFLPLGNHWHTTWSPVHDRLRSMYLFQLVILFCVGG